MTFQVKGFSFAEVNEIKAHTLHTCELGDLANKRYGEPFLRLRASHEKKVVERSGKK